MGLLYSLTAQAAGFERIVMCDIDQGRLDFAFSNGFASVAYLVKPRPSKTVEEQLHIPISATSEITTIKFKDRTTIRKPHSTFKCTGIQSSVQTAIYVSAVSWEVLSHSKTILTSSPGY